MVDICEAILGSQMAMDMMSPIERTFLGPISIAFTCYWYRIEEESVFDWFDMLEFEPLKIVVNGEVRYEQKEED